MFCTKYIIGNKQVYRISFCAHECYRLTVGVKESVRIVKGDNDSDKDDSSKS